MRAEVKVLIAFCLIGTCIAVVGAALRSSDNEQRENLGVLVHRAGMGVMLIGFGGLFLCQLSLTRRRASTFSWSDVDGKLTVIPNARQEILNISLKTDQKIPPLYFDLLDLRSVRCLIARGQTIDKTFVSRLVKLQKLQVFDLQDAILEEGALQELELLESLEILLLAGCLEPSQAKELRIALPEARMIFDPR